VLGPVGMHDRAVIEVNELTKRYGAVTAVDGLSFSVRPGQVTGFLGPNGAGKTTTLRMLLGLNTPTSGTATIAGRSYRSLGVGLRHVGALLSADDVHKGRTARAHLHALARSNGLPKRRVDAVLQEVGLLDASARRISGFSLGMRQRLGIAAALLGDPPVLMFDEPINGLDPEGVRWTRQLFRRLAGEGRTVLVSSHLMTEMEHTADHLVVIGRGRLIADEPLAAFAGRARHATVAVRAREPQALAAALTARGATVQTEGPDRLVVSGMDIERIAEIAFAKQIMLHEIVSRTGGLEAAFMELTADSVEYRAGKTQ
jgi:ABC-2 type transport system ATP-binding protein